MAVFPTLNPSGTRTFTPGEYPHTVYTSLSGDESRVRHSSVMTGSEVKLSFSGLSESDMLSILSHYQGQFGAYYAFTLPSIIFAGMADATVFTLSRYQWRYQAAPVVRDLPCGTHTVDVQLVSVAPEPAAAQGARLVMVAAIVGGQAASASGLDLTITASLEYGSAFAAGLSETVTITFTAGAASGGSEAYGASLGIGFALNPGAAAAANGLQRTVTVSIAGGKATGATSGALLTVTVGFAAGDGSSGRFINYSNFASTTGLSLVNTSGVTNNYLYLTNTSENTAGNAWTSTTRLYNSNFTVRWAMECSGSAIGASGFCLQWHTANNVTGDTGPIAGRVQNGSVLHALTFRTFGGDNVAWFKNSSQQGSAQASALSSPYWRQTVYYWAEYDHAQSKMFIYYATSATKPSSPSHTFTSFSFGSTAYYMGFGAATSNGSLFADNHILKSWIAE